MCLFYGAGAGSALLGKEAAMACTVAVETVITEHYERYARHCLFLA
jgi:ubiquinone biosynthesis monooxygenase Coq7